jgi:hypothetical protein
MSCKRVTGLGANHRVYATARTKCSLTDSVFSIDPITNLGWSEDGAAVKTTARLTRDNLIAMEHGMFVRGRYVFGGHARRLTIKLTGARPQPFARKKPRARASG